MKKFLSLVTAIVMTVSLCIMPVYAQTYEEAAADAQNAEINYNRSVPLEVKGNKIVKQGTDEMVVLRGVNVPSMDWGMAEHLFESMTMVYDSWGANLIRLPINPKYWKSGSIWDEKNLTKEQYQKYIDDMVNRETIESTVLENLMINIRIAPPDRDITNDNGMEILTDGGITTADLKECDNMEDAVDEVLVGNTAVFFDNSSRAIIISSKGFPKRSVDKPDTEAVVQGPQEAFTESVRTNTVLVRRRIKTPLLKCKSLKFGKKTKTDIALMYIEGTVKNSLLNSITKKLNKIKSLDVLDSGYVEQMIEENKYSPFPQVQMTERPDKTASALLEGRVAVIVDTSPFVLLLPTVLACFYQSSEDYYERWEIMSFIRIIRYVCGFFAFSLPALYIAITLFHPSMIPTDLALKISGSRAPVPINTVFEVVLLEVVFEALREAGIRLPQAIGSTLGIVGGIIIGQAAVEAGLVSPMVVIIVSLTGICSFAIPNISLVSAFRLLKYFMILLSSIFGMLGFAVGVFMVLTHLCSLKSFGKAYVSPFNSQSFKSAFQDTVFRFPLDKMKESSYKEE